MKNPSGKSPHRAVELFPICFLVYTYAYPSIFWLSSFSVALSAVIIRMGGALFGRHTRVSALFFLKNLTSSLYGLFPVIPFPLDSIFSNLGEGSRTQSGPDLRWPVHVSGHLYHIPSPQAMQEHPTQPGASSILADPVWNSH